MSEERRAFNNEMFTTLNQISASIGEIKGTLDGLAGEHGRVTMIENAQDKADTRFWIQTAVILPLLSAFHFTAKKLGF